MAKLLFVTEAEWISYDRDSEARKAKIFPVWFLGKSSPTLDLE